MAVKYDTNNVTIDKMKNRTYASPPTSVTSTGNEPSINTKSKRKYDHVSNVTEERWKEIRENFPHFPINKDILADRKEAFIRLPRFIEDFVVNYIIYDKRDAIMASLIMNILCTTVPLTCLLYNYPSHLLGAFSMTLTYFMYLQRFVLMLHYAEHRKLFQHPYHIRFCNIYYHVLFAYFLVCRRVCIDYIMLSCITSKIMSSLKI